MISIDAFRDVASMQVYCKMRYDTDIPKELASWIISMANDKLKHHEQLAASWIRNRLHEKGLFFAQYDPLTDTRLSCELHVFFLGLLETEEMLENLSRKESRSIESQEARSKVTKTTLVIRPIDRVANRIAPQFRNQKERVP